jgi:hypothetical protein
LSKTSHDFGEVDEGKEVSTVFDFRNDGPGPLIIQKVDGGCSCTSQGIDVEGRAYNYGDPIPAGSKGTIRALVRTLGFVNEKETHLNVFTNDPAIPEFEGTPFGLSHIKIHLKILRRFAFEPEPLVDFGEISTSEAREAFVIMKSTKKEPFQILGFDCPEKDLARFCEFRAEPTDDTAMLYKIVGTLSPTAPFGPFQKEVKVFTKPEAPATVFRLKGVVFGPVKIEPPQVHFLVVTKGRSATKKFYVRNTHAGHVLKVSNLRLLNPNDHRALTGGPAAAHDSPIKDHISFNVTETDPGKVAVVEIVVKDTMPAMQFNTVLALDTGVPGASPNGSSEVRVLILGLVR